MIYDNDLDPLGDGSLLQSFTFNETYSDVQQTEVLIDGAEDGIFINDGKLGSCKNAWALDSGQSSPIQGVMNNSISFWAGFPSDDTSLEVHLGDYYYGGWRCNVAHSSGVLNIQIDISYYTTIYANITVPLKDWFHIVCTYNPSTGAVSLYVDKVLEGTATEVSISFSTNPLKIRNWGKLGRIDQLMIWDNDLSITDVETIYDIAYLPPPDVTIRPNTITASVSLLPATVRIHSLVTTSVSPLSLGLISPLIIVENILLSVTVTPNILTIDTLLKSVNIKIPSFLDTDLDPFGDGSLLQSFLFENDVLNQQGTNDFLNGGQPTIYENGMLNKYAKYNYLEGSFDSTNSTGISGDTPCSFSLWSYNGSEIGVDVAFGEFDQRYNVVFDKSSYSTTSPIEFSLHKGASTFSSSAPPLNEWYLLTYTYDGNGVNKFYVNDTLVWTTSLTMKHNNKRISGRTVYSGSGNPYSILEQLCIWNKELSQTEVTEILHIGAIDADISISVYPTVLSLGSLLKTPLVKILSPNVVVTVDTLHIDMVALEIIQNVSTNIDLVHLNFSLLTPLIYPLEPPNVVVTVDITHNVELFEIYTFDIIHTYWHGYEEVNPLTNYGLFEIIHKIDDPTIDREIVDLFNIKHKLDFDYVKSGYINPRTIDRTPEIHLPLETDISDRTGNYVPSVTAGSVSFGESMFSSSDIGNPAFFDTDSKVGFTTISLDADFTFSFWISLSTTAWYFEKVMDGFRITPINNGVELTLDTTKITFYSEFVMNQHFDDRFQHFIIRRKGADFTCLVNGINSPIFLTSGTGFTETKDITFIGNDNAYVSDFVVFKEALDDDELLTLLHSPKSSTNGVLRFDFVQVCLLDTDDVIKVSILSILKIQQDCANDQNNVVDRFYFKSIIEETNYKLHTRELRTDVNTLPSCKDFYEFKDDTYIHDFSDRFEERVAFYGNGSDDANYPLSNNTIKLAKFLPKRDVFGTGLWRPNGSINRHTFSINEEYSTLCFWYKADFSRLLKTTIMDAGVYLSAMKDFTGMLRSSFDILEDYEGYFGGQNVLGVNVIGFSIFYAMSDSEMIRWCSRPHHFTFVSHRKNYRKIYIDGKYVAIVNISDQVFDPIPYDHYSKLKTTIGFTENSPQQLRGTISHIRTYHRKINNLEMSVLSNDPYFVIGSEIQSFTFYRFNIKHSFDEIVTSIKKLRINDIFNDESCQFYWSFIDGVFDVAESGRRKKVTYKPSNISEVQVRAYLETYSDIDKIGYHYGKTLRFNETPTTETYTITTSSYMGTDGGVLGIQGGGDHGAIVEYLKMEGTGYADRLLLGESVLIDYIDFLPNAWNDFAFVISKLGSSNFWKMEIYINGFYQGYNADVLPPFVSRKNGSQLDRILPFSVGEAYGLSVFSNFENTNVGGVRLFNRRLSEEEIMYLVNDAKNGRFESDIVTTLESTSIKEESIFIRHHVDPNYIVFSSVNNVDPFGDNSGSYLWQFDGGYKEVNDNAIQIPSSLPSYGDGVFGEAINLSNYGQYIGVQVNTAFGDGDCAWSCHIKGDINTYSSVKYTVVNPMFTINWMANIGLSVKTTLNNLIISTIPMTHEEYCLEYRHIVINIKNIGEDMVLYTCYIDGMKTGSLEYINRSEFSEFTIGASSQGSSTFIDQLRVFDRLLLLDEIETLKSEKNAPKSLNIVQEIKSTRFEKLDIISRLESFHYQRFNIVHSFKTISTFLRFDIVQKQENEYKSIFIRRINV